MPVNFKNLKKYRTLLGFTQSQVANALGIDRSTYSYYELGKHVPDICMIQKLMKIYNADYRDLLENEKETEALVSDSSFESLSGENTDQELNEEKIASITALSRDERRLVSAYRMLTKSQKLQIIKVSLDFIKQNRD